ncbi:MAG: glycosyltransferase family 2 protein [Verrucomicrobia bacterium]|nr:glycosyltransferase family 2 protein [Verrucomicrobiota bacterium]MBS0645404.1 glycosyltransferase family 2 protein [Verrucomicrobiota bacterium]
MKISSPLVTAIIATYQRPQWLQRAVRSVLVQSFPHLQVLIADNASGPATDEVVGKFMQQDARVKVIKHPVNLGMTANFQTALMQVTTPYVCFLPDDDFLGPSFFEEALPFFERYPDIAACGGGGLIINQDFEVSSILNQGQTIPAPGYYPPPRGLFAYLRSSFGITFPGLLFKTDIVKQLGGFDLRIRIGIDEDLVSQCFAKFPVYLLTDHPCYFGFQHAASLSRITKDFALYEDECLIFHEKLKQIPLCPEEQQEIDQFFQSRRLKIVSSAYHSYCQNKEFKKAYAEANKLQRVYPSRKWKRKKNHAKLCQYWPKFHDLYQTLKVFEQRLRGKKQAKSSGSASVVAHPDVEKWRAYALSLEAPN